MIASRAAQFRREVRRRVGGEHREAPRLRAGALPLAREHLGGGVDARTATIGEVRGEGAREGVEALDVGGVSGHLLQEHVAVRGGGPHDVGGASVGVEAARRGDTCAQGRVRAVAHAAEEDASDGSDGDVASARDHHELLAVDFGAGCALLSRRLLLAVRAALFVGARLLGREVCGVGRARFGRGVFDGGVVRR